MMNINILPPSVSSLYLEFSVSGEKLSSGTGFVVETIKGPHLITNRHCVTGKDNFTGACLDKMARLPTEVTIWHNKRNQLGSWVRRTESLTGNEQGRWIEHPKLGEIADFVALPLTQLDDVHLFPYGLSDETNELTLMPTDILRIVGFPLGMSSSGGGMVAVWVTGFVASEPGLDYHGLPAFLVDCRAREGQSGSAVIFHVNTGSIHREGDQSKMLTKGTITKFVGIYSGRIHKESDIGIVWKRPAILELVQSIQ